MTRLVCPKFVCLCVLIVALAGAWGCGATKQSYVAKGNQLFARARYEEAALNYRAAIQRDASFGEAYYRLGLTAVKLNQPREAYQASFRAVQLLPGNVSAKKNFADICLSLYLADPNHSQTLYNQIDKLSNEFLGANRKSYEGLMLKGYLASTDRKPKEAIEYLRAALRLNSSNAGVVTEFAHLLIQNGGALEGEQMARNLVFRKKTSYGPAYDLLHGFYLNAKQPVEAESVLQAKVNNNPKNADYILELATHYNLEHNTPAMAAALQRLLDAPQDFPQAPLWVGDFYLRLRDYPAAINYYQQGASSSPDPKTKVVCEIRNVLAVLREGKQDEALSLAERFQKENPKDTAVLRTHADLLLGRGHAGDADVIVREFQTLSDENPNDAVLRMQLGRAYLLQGNLESARKQFLEAVQRRNDLTAARYELARVNLIQHHPQDAVQQASAILKTLPNDRQARLLYATSLIGAGDGETARAVLARLIKDFPQDSEPQIQLGLLALAGKNFTQAIQILGKYRANGDARTFTALASAYLHEKQFEPARVILTEGLGKWPESSALLEQLANTESLSGHYDLALTQYQKALSFDPKSIDLRRSMAAVCDLQGDHSRALAMYQEAHRMAPDDVAAAVGVADALARAGRVDEAKAMYQSVAKAHPENAPALNNVAFFLADTGGDLDEALRLASAALAKIPGQPSFSDTIGYIYLKKGMLDSAIESFRNLAHRYPESASFHYHLGLALFQKGEKAVARKELQAALADHPSAQDTTRIRELLNEIS
jgi:tetratricopeptide (TPR) repeat protein